MKSITIVAMFANRDQNSAIPTANCRSLHGRQYGSVIILELQDSTSCQYSNTTAYTDFLTEHRIRNDYGNNGFLILLQNVVNLHVLLLMSFFRLRKMIGNIFLRPLVRSAQSFITAYNRAPSVHSMRMVKHRKRHRSLALSSQAMPSLDMPLLISITCRA